MQNWMFFLFLWIPISVGIAEVTRSRPSDPDWNVQWGTSLTATLNALGAHALTPQQGSQPMSALSWILDYQPQWLQKYGILSMGTHLCLYPTQQIQKRTLLMSYGGQIRYLLRYGKDQLLVPVLGYAVEWLPDPTHSGLLMHGPNLGLWILLNRIEPLSSISLYRHSGILRSYWVIDYQILEGKTRNVWIHGGSYFSGLRVEW